MSIENKGEKIEEGKNILCSLFLTYNEKSVLFMGKGGGAKLYWAVTVCK